MSTGVFWHRPNPYRTLPRYEANGSEATGATTLVEKQQFFARYQALSPIAESSSNLRKHYEYSAPCAALPRWCYGPEAPPSTSQGSMPAIAGAGVIGSYRPKTRRHNSSRNEFELSTSVNFCVENR